MNKYTLGLYCLLSLYSLYCFADTRVTIVESTTEQQITDASPILFNDLLIYQIESEQQTELWAYNTITQEKEEIFSGEITSTVNNLFRSARLLLINDSVIFNAVDGENVRFFKTDGTSEGTFALDSPPLALSSSYFKDGLLFTWAEDGELVTTDGETVRKHAINFAEINKVCGFNNNDVIALENSPVPATIVRSSNRQRTNLSEYMPIGYYGINLTMLRLPNHCLISAESATTKEVLLVAETGEVSKLSDVFDLTQLTEYLVFKDRLYAFQAIEDTNIKKIVRFNENYDDFDKEYTVTDTDRFIRVNGTQEFIVTQSITQTSDQVTSYTHILNENLELNQELSGSSQPFHAAYPILDGELYSTVINRNNTHVKALSTNLNFPPSMTTLIVDKQITAVITNPLSNDAFLLLKDRAFNSYSIAQLTDKPHINHSTAGIWHDPMVQNQGLVINRGQRTDGSIYMFVSVYTQDAGTPLWLAGNADIEIPQASIEIDLAYYEGTGFFEPETDTIITVWGKVRLEMTSCDGLLATFTQPSGQSRNINLVRINNTQFNHLCSE